MPLNGKKKNPGLYMWRAGLGRGISTPGPTSKLEAWPQLKPKSGRKLLAKTGMPVNREALAFPEFNSYYNKKKEKKEKEKNIPIMS